MDEENSVMAAEVAFIEARHAEQQAWQAWAATWRDGEISAVVAATRAEDWWDARRATRAAYNHFLHVLYGLMDEDGRR